MNKTSKFRTGICFLVLLVFFSCNKSSNIIEQLKPASIDFSKLVLYDWLITPPIDIGYHCAIRNQILYQDKIFTRDTTRLYYHADSTWRRHSFPTVTWFYDTIPHTGLCGSYLPHGGSDYSGTYSLNATDSTITTTLIFPGYTFPPVIHKVLLLTNDSLKLWHPSEGTTIFYAY